MSNQGDDCYFFFYSTCTKGDSCPFRHCNAALGNETVCTLWQEGRCFRQICKFRHMEIDKKRSEIPCFWENQLSGCQKGNCAFHHTKGRYVDGVFIPPNKTQSGKPEPSETELQIPQTASKLPAPSTTHLRGVKKIEATENVPSPTHPPVVINAADDDEDDDDQISEEGDELKTSGQQGGHLGARRLTPQKMDVLNKGSDFGIKTLEEIKSNRKKVHKESKDGAVSTINVLESSQSVAVAEKVTVIRTVMFSKNDPPGRSLALRLGKRKILSPDSSLGGESLPTVKKSLSERLGMKMSTTIVGPDANPKKIQVPRLLKDRLGLPPEQNSTETERAANPTTEFHIKTLHEIRQEKASQRKEQDIKCLSSKSEDDSSSKSHLSTKPLPDIHVKSLHEIKAEKKLRQLKDRPHMDENSIDKTDCRKVRDLHTSQNVDDKHLLEAGKQGGQADLVWNRLGERESKLSHLTDTISSTVDSKKPLSVSLKGKKEISQTVEKVQIKTLEEIRKEKALRLQHMQQTTSTESLAAVSPPEIIKSSQKRIRRLSKPQDLKGKSIDQGTSDVNSQNNNAASIEKSTAHSGSPISVTVKSAEKSDIDTSLETQSFTDAQKITQPASPVESDEPKVNVEPKVMKNQSPTKPVLKRKAQQSSPVAEVKPLNTANTSADKVLLPVAESSDTENVKSTSPKRLKESSQGPASDHGCSGTPQMVIKSRRASIASSGKPSVLADDFDELIWDISDGKLEDEIDLDPSKDEDDLLMELSEMIDS